MSIFFNRISFSLTSFDCPGIPQRLRPKLNKLSGLSPTYQQSTFNENTNFIKHNIYPHHLLTTFFLKFLPKHPTKTLKTPRSQSSLQSSSSSSSMKCRIHPSNLSSGVCACCLRDRLSALTTLDPPTPHITQYSITSDFTDQSSTSQPSSNRKSRIVKFSILNPLRGSKNTPKKVVETNPTRLSALILPHRIKRNNKSTAIQPAAEDESRGRSRKPAAGSGRGMSPASDDGGVFTAKRKAVVPTQTQNASSRSVSSFAMCLNPVVRPSHGHRRSYGLGQAVVAGEIRGTVVRRCDGGGAAVADPTFVAGINRSRKLVDLGKIWV